MAHLLGDLGAIEGDGRGGRSPVGRALVRRARRSARRALRIAAEVAREQPEAYRLAGRLAWLLGNEGRAVTWWEKSLRAGRSLGALPEVGRTACELGRRLVAAGQGDRLVDGLPASTHVAEGPRLLGQYGLVPDDGPPRDQSAPSPALASGQR